MYPALRAFAHTVVGYGAYLAATFPLGLDLHKVYARPDDAEATYYLVTRHTVLSRTGMAGAATSVHPIDGRDVGTVYNTEAVAWIASLTPIQRLIFRKQMRHLAAHVLRE